MTEGIIIKTKIIMKMMILNYQIMQFKIPLKIQKSIIHQKRPESNDENVHKVQQKKTQTEIVVDSMGK